MLESLAWALLLVALVAWKVLPGFTGGMSPDGVQYLSVARNLMAGEGPATSVIYFDAERSTGLMPAPQVTFPPGYSAVVAALGAWVQPIERAALLVSLLSLGATLLLVRTAASWLGLSPWLARGMLAMLALNALSLELSSSVISEPLFTLLATLAILLLLGALRAGLAQRRALLLAAGAGTVFGAAYWVRYSGLFFVVGLVGLAVVALLLRRRRLLASASAAAALAAVIAGAGLLRNVLLVGNWRGGNSKAVSNPIAEVVKNSLRTVDDLLFGSAPISANLLPRALFLALVAAGLVLLWRAARAPAAAPRREALLADPRLDAALAMLVLLGTYCAAMVYAGLTTVISYGSRMFAPVVPLGLLLLATLLTMLAGRQALDAPAFARGRWVLAAALLPYAWLNLGWFAATPLQQGAPAAAARFDVADPERGITPRTAIGRVLGADGVLAATDGQMASYALGVPTLVLAGEHYTEVRWTEAAVREAMARYGARALAVTGEVPGVDPIDALPSPFLRAVFEGAVPGWLEVVARNDAVVVLRPRPARAEPATFGTTPGDVAVGRPSGARAGVAAAGAEQPAP